MIVPNNSSQELKLTEPIVEKFIGATLKASSKNNPKDKTSTTGSSISEIANKSLNPSSEVDKLKNEAKLIKNLSSHLSVFP